MSYAPLNHCVANDSNAVRVGDHYGAFQKARLFHPSGAGHFAISVLRKPAGEDSVVHGILPARKDRGDAGANRAFADLQLAFTGNQSGVADQNARYIGNGVEFSGRAVKRDAEVACARFFCCVRLRR